MKALQQYTYKYIYIAFHLQLLHALHDEQEARSWIKAGYRPCACLENRWNPCITAPKAHRSCAWTEVLPRDIREESGQDCGYQLIQFPGFVKGGNATDCWIPFDSIRSSWKTRKELCECTTVEKGRKRMWDLHGFPVWVPLNQLNRDHRIIAWGWVTSDVQVDYGNAIGSTIPKFCHKWVL